MNLRNCHPSQSEPMPIRVSRLLPAALCLAAGGGTVAAAGRSAPLLAASVSVAAGAGAAFVGLRARAASRDGVERERLQVTLASIADGVVTCDAEARITTLNPVAERLCGILERDAVGRPVEDILKLVNEDGTPDNPTRQVLSTGRPVPPHNHTKVFRSTGGPVPVEISAAPIRGGDGELRGAVVVVRDVTVRHQQQQAVEAAQNYAEAVIDTVREPLVVVTEDLIVRGANRAFVQLFGGDAIGTAGRKLSELAGCDWVTPAVGARLQAAFAAGPFEGFEVAHTTFAGPRALVLNARKIVRQAGEAELLLVAVEDVTAQRAAEELAHASQERYRLIVESATEYAIFSTDPAGIITTWNPGSEAVFGWFESDMIGRSFDVLFTPEDCAADAPAVILAAAANGGRGEDNRWHVKSDGTRFFASGVVTPVVTASGVLKGFTKIARDVTTAKKAEEELANNRRFLRSSLDALTPHIAVLDENGVIIEINGAWRRFASENGLSGGADGTGTDDYALGHNYLDACDVTDSECIEDGQAVSNGIRRVLNGEESEFTLEYPCHSLNEERWYQMRVTRFFAGTKPRAVVAHENVTMRHLAEVSMRARTEQLKRLAGVAAHVNVATDVKSVVGVVTQAARTLLGSKQAAMVLNDCPDCPGAKAVSLAEDCLGYADYVPDANQFYSTLHNLGLPLRLSVSELEAHPGWTEFAKTSLAPPLRGLLVAPLAGRDGRPVGVIQLSDRERGDFTEDDEHLIVQLAQMAAVAVENARLYERLMEADRLKNEFLAMLAHELRNPLAPIGNATEVLRRAADQPETAAMARQIIERQLQHMVRLVDDLLDASRVSRGQITLRKVPMSLADAVRTAVETSRPIIEASGHTLRVTESPTPIGLDADPTRVAQVVGNLLTNAAKYTPPGGQITLTIEREASEAVIRVADTGVGLPPEMLHRVFEMFTQVDTSLERSQGGLGIGLTLVKRLVELHGGSVTAESAGAGHGSTFTVRLPALPENAPAAGIVAEPPSQPRGPLKILVADDNADSAESLALMLGILGHEVRTAGDGEVAVALAESFRPNVILTDIGMPKLNGYDVARLVRAMPWAEATVVAALTGWGQDDDKERSRGAGVDYHLVKPVDLDALNRVLATAGR